MANKVPSMSGSGMSSLYMKYLAPHYALRRFHGDRAHLLPSGLLYRDTKVLSREADDRDTSSFQKCWQARVENPRGAKPSAERKGPWVKQGGS